MNKKWIKRMKITEMNEKLPLWKNFQQLLLLLRFPFSLSLLPSQKPFQLPLSLNSWKERDLNSLLRFPLNPGLIESQTRCSPCLHSYLNNNS